MTFPAKLSAFLARGAFGAFAVLLVVGCGSSISDASKPALAAVQASALSTANPAVTTDLTTVVRPPAGGPVPAGSYRARSRRSAITRGGCSGRLPPASRRRACMVHRTG